MLSRVSPVIYVSGAFVFAQFADCISVEGIVHGTWNVLGTPTLHLGRASPEDLCSRFIRVEIEQLLHDQLVLTRHRRLTLVDLSPSPLALYLWSIMLHIYWVFDPAIRLII